MGPFGLSRDCLGQTSLTFCAECWPGAAVCSLTVLFGETLGQERECRGLRAGRKCDLAADGRSSKHLVCDAREAFT